MKPFYFLSSLFVALVLNISLTHPVQAEPTNSYPSLPATIPTTDENTPQPQNQASDLITQPASINNYWMGVNGRNQLNPQSNNTIPLIRDGCRSASPLEILSDPGAVLKECEKQADAEPPARTEQLEYFKVPRLDSGVKLQISDF